MKSLFCITFFSSVKMVNMSPAGSVNRFPDDFSLLRFTLIFSYSRWLSSVVVVVAVASHNFF